MRISTVSSFGRSDLLQKLPKPALSITFDDQVVDPVSDGYDCVAWRRHPESGLISRLAYLLNSAIVAAPGSGFAERAASAARILTHMLIARRAGIWMAVPDAGRDFDFDPTPAAALTLSDPEVLVDAVFAGAGIQANPMELLGAIPCQTSHKPKFWNLFRSNRNFGRCLRASSRRIHNTDLALINTDTSLGPHYPRLLSRTSRGGVMEV